MAPQGSLVGSRLDTTLISLPLMEKESSPVTCTVKPLIKRYERYKNRGERRGGRHWRRAG